MLWVIGVVLFNYEIMRTLLLFLVNSMVVFTSVNGQSAFKLIQSKTNCSPVTIRMLNQYVHLEKQLELQDAPEKLALLNYQFADSYIVDKQQMVLKSQLLLIDIRLHEHLRMPHQEVRVYDENSGLTIVLKSHDTMEEEMLEIKKQYALASK